MAPRSRPTTPRAASRINTPDRQIRRSTRESSRVSRVTSLSPVPPVPPLPSTIPLSAGSDTPSLDCQALANKWMQEGQAHDPVFGTTSLTRQFEEVLKCDIQPFSHCQPTLFPTVAAIYGLERWIPIAIPKKGSRGPTCVNNGTVNRTCHRGAFPAFAYTQGQNHTQLYDKDRPEEAAAAVSTHLSLPPAKRRRSGSVMDRPDVFDGPGSTLGRLCSPSAPVNTEDGVQSDLAHVSAAQPSTPVSLQPPAVIEVPGRPLGPLRGWEEYLSKFMPEGSQRAVPDFVIPPTPQPPVQLGSTVSSVIVPSSIISAQMGVSRPLASLESHSSAPDSSSAPIAEKMVRFKDEIQAVLALPVETAQAHLEACRQAQQQAVSVVKRAFEWFETVRLAAESDRVAIDDVRKDRDEKATTLRDLDSRVVKLLHEQLVKDNEIQRLHKQYEFVQDHLNAALREQRAVEKRMAEAHEQREIALGEKAAAARESEEMRATARRAIAQRDEAISIRKEAEAAITDAHLHISELRTELSTQSHVIADLQGHIALLKQEQEGTTAEAGRHPSSVPTNVIPSPTVQDSLAAIPNNHTGDEAFAEFVNMDGEADKDAVKYGDREGEGVRMDEGQFSDDTKREISHQISDADLDALLKVASQHGRSISEKNEGVPDNTETVELADESAPDRFTREPSFPGAFI